MISILLLTFQFSLISLIYQYFRLLFLQLHQKVYLINHLATWSLLNVHNNLKKLRISSLHAVLFHKSMMKQAAFFENYFTNLLIHAFLTTEFENSVNDDITKENANGALSKIESITPFIELVSIPYNGCYEKRSSRITKNRSRWIITLWNSKLHWWCNYFKQIIWLINSNVNRIGCGMTTRDFT